jgi:hypothetical protein
VRAIVAAVVMLAGWDAIAGDRVEGGRFRPVAVYVDTGSAPLAAYQVEVTVGTAEPTAKIVGVEGGEAAAFRPAPYYDPAALQGGRIVIAAFTTDTTPPHGHVRVATLHLFEPAGCVPGYRARLVVAVTADGAIIPGAEARVSPEPGGPTT